MASSSERINVVEWSVNVLKQEVDFIIHFSETETTPPADSFSMSFSDALKLSALLSQSVQVGGGHRPEAKAANIVPGPGKKQKTGETRII